MGDTLRFDSSRFLQESVEDAVLVIDVAAGRCLALDGAARVLWPSLLAGVSREALLQAAEAAFAPAQGVRGAVEVFLAQLVAERVLQEVPGRGVVPQVEAGGVFQPPRLQLYDDLEELLKPEED